MAEPPVLLFHLFTTNARDRILAQLKRNPPPTGTRVFFGTYGISKDDALTITRAGFEFAPTFHLAPKENAAIRAKRQLAARRGALHPEFAGPMPTKPSEPRIPSEHQREWGIELGKRFRDQWRLRKNQHFPMTSWQLDEIFSEARDRPSSNPFRQFVGGVVRGIAAGRPELGDEPLPGFVWFAFRALDVLPGTSVTSDLATFWDDLNTGARCIVGEEYPDFVPHPVDAAQRRGRPHHTLARHSNAAAKALAGRYIVGMSPGWHTGGSLGGNIRALDNAGVTAWRNDFIEKRMQVQRPVGYGQFFFAGNRNTAPGRVENAVDSLRHAALKLAGV